MTTEIKGEGNTNDELRSIIAQREEQLRVITLDRDRFRADFQTQADWIAEWKRVAAGLESQIKDAKQQLAQEREYTGIVIQRLNEQLGQAQAEAKNSDWLGKANGWLSPQDHSALREQLAQAQAESDRLKDGWNNANRQLQEQWINFERERDEAKRLEAKLHLQESIEDGQPTLGDYHQSQIELIQYVDKCHRLEAALKTVNGYFGESYTHPVAAQVREALKGPTK